MVNRKKEIVACESSIYLGMVGWPVPFLALGSTLLERGIILSHGMVR